MVQNDNKVGWRVEIENSDQAIQQLKSLGNAAKDVGTQTTASMSDSEEATNLYTKAQDLAAVAAQKASTAHRDLALGIASVGTSAVGVVVGITTLERSHLRLEIASKTLASAQEHLKTLMESGKASYSEIAIAQQAVAIAQERVQLQQQQLNDSMLNFATNIANTVVSSVFIVTRALDALKAAKVAQVAADAAMAASSWTASGAVATLGTSATAATPAIVGMGAALWAALAPVLPVVLAIAGAMAIWESNIGNLRGTVEKATGTHLSLVDAMKGLMGSTQSATTASEDFSNSIGGMSGVVNTGTSSIQGMDNSVQGLLSDFDKLQNSIDHVKGALGSVNDATNAFLQEAQSHPAEQLKQSADAILESLRIAKDKLAQGAISMGDFNIGFKDQLLPEIISYVERMSDAGESTTDFMKKLKDLGVIGKDAWETITTALDKYNKKMAEADGQMESFKKKRQQLFGDRSIDINQLGDGFWSGHGGFATLDLAYSLGLRDFGQKILDLMAKADAVGYAAFALAAGSQPFWDQVGIGGVRGSPYLSQFNYRTMQGGPGGGVNTSHPGGTFDGAVYKAQYDKMQMIMLLGLATTADFANTKGAQDAARSFILDPNLAKAYAAIHERLYKWNWSLSLDDNVRAAVGMVDDLLKGISTSVAEEYGIERIVHDPGWSGNVKMAAHPFDAFYFNLPTYTTGAGQQIHGKGAQNYNVGQLGTVHADYTKLEEARFESMFSSKSDYNAALKEIEGGLHMSYDQIIKELLTPNGIVDLRNMLAFANLPQIKALGT